MSEKFIYLISCFLSCMVGVGLIQQFLDDRYKRIYKNRWIYIAAQTSMIFAATLVNQLQSPIWNMTIFFLCSSLFSGLLYTGGRWSALGRIIETGIFYILLGVFEGLGGFLIASAIGYSVFPGGASVLKESIITVLSKIILIFLYYVLLRRFLKKGSTLAFKEYALYLFMLIYSIINMIVIGMEPNQKTIYILFCMSYIGLLFANIYAFYYLRMWEEKRELDFQLALMKQQENLQFEYYKMQKEKYDQSVSILHDVSKHIRSIEELYQGQQMQEAMDYTKEINSILKPLIPVQYTDNPMFDILLADQKLNIERKGISFKLNLEGAELGFIEPVDITILFGNLLENAVAACKACTGDSYILLEIKNQYDMAAIRIENTVEKEVCLVDDMPVQPGAGKTGIGTLNVLRCVEKYGGSILYKNGVGTFICDILLNR